MKSNKLSYLEMFIGITKWKPTFPTLVVLLIMAGACSDDEGSSQPQVPNPGNIEITIETDGKDEDPDGYVIVVDGSSMETDPNGTYLVENKSPGSYSVELTEVPSHCEGEGEMVRQVTVTEDGTVQVAYKVTCKAILRNKLLYIRGLDYGTGFEIYKMDYDGENQEMIYNEDLSHSTSIAVSTDGTRLYFNGSPGGSGESKIFAISADGEELEEIFEGPSFIRGISLSPDGKKLAFTMDLEMDIYTFDLETKELIKITDEPDIQFFNPIWNHDGLKLYVTKQNPESDIRVSIWEMNVDGSGLNQILADPDYSISSAHFSPIYDELVVIGSNYLPDNSVPTSIYLTNRELDDLRNISEGMEGFFVSSNNPRWSPDGSEIIFYTQYHSNRSHIYRYTLEGSELKQLTSDEAFYLNPVFSPVMR